MAATRLEVADDDEVADDEQLAPLVTTRPPGVSRWVDHRGNISLVGFTYRVGPSFAGEAVEVVCQGGLVEILHAGVLVATHAQRLRAEAKRRSPAPQAGRARRAATGPSVTRLADANGVVTFAGTSYRAGRAWAHSSIRVTVVGASVQLSVDGKVVRVHPIRHDRAKEHGAFATPNGGPVGRRRREG